MKIRIKEKIIIFLLLSLTVISQDYSDIVKNSKEIFNIDLKKFLNWSYDDKDEAPGWIGTNSEMDLADIPKGNVKLCGIPFYIYPPEENNGNCIICAGYSYQLLLTKVSLNVGPIPVRKKADMLFFLHSSGWVQSRKGEPIGIYRIIYEDGKKEEIKIRRGYEIEDWWHINQNTNLENGKVAWTTKLKKLNREVGICMIAWENPYPEKEIKEIIIEGTSNAQLFVFAITGIKK